MAVLESVDKSEALGLRMFCVLLASIESYKSCEGGKRKRQLQKKNAKSNG